LILRKVQIGRSAHSGGMSTNDLVLRDRPVEVAPSGTVLVRRGQPGQEVLFLERGCVVLGLVGTDGLMEHQLGELHGPAWLECASAVLEQSGIVDAVAQTEVHVRHLPRSEFLAFVRDNGKPVWGVLTDVAKAYRQQTELAVSRLAKGAEERCAEWLLRQAQASSAPAPSAVPAVQLQQRKRAIAAQLGIAPETLSRVLRNLRERGLISGAGRMVQLVDVAGLRVLAGAM
jgi:CRP-like cAMP-binding protein